MKNLLKKLFTVRETTTFDWESDHEARKERMERKRQKAIEELGERWVLHPKHTQKRLEKPRPV